MNKFLLAAAAALMLTTPAHAEKWYHEADEARYTVSDDEKELSALGRSIELIADDMRRRTIRMENCTRDERDTAQRAQEYDQQKLTELQEKRAEMIARINRRKGN